MTINLQFEGKFKGGLAPEGDENTKLERTSIRDSHVAKVKGIPGPVRYQVSESLIVKLFFRPVNFRSSVPFSPV